MTRKVFDELDDIFKNKKPREIVDDSDVVAFVEKRRLKEIFNQVIENYLKVNKMNIDNFGKKDIKILTKDYNDIQKEVFIQQVMYHLETTHGKSIKWIRENGISLLLKEMEANGGTNTGADQSPKVLKGERSTKTLTKDDKRASRRDRISNKIASKKLLRNKSS